MNGNYMFQVCLSKPKGFNFTISGKFMITYDLQNNLGFNM